MTHYPNRQFVSSRHPQNSWQRNQNTVAFVSSIKLGPVTHTVLVALMVAVLGLIYLVQVTQSANYGYTLSALSSKKTDLENKKSDLEVENARLQSLNRIASSSQAQSLTTPTETAYVQ